MLEFHEKRRLKRFLYSKWMVVLLLIIIPFLLNAVWNIFQKERSTSEKRAMVERELNELAQREEVLQQEIEQLNTERGLEGEVREKFDVARAGEVVVVLVDAPGSEQASEEELEKSWWERILEWF